MTPNPWTASGVHSQLHARWQNFVPALDAAGSAAYPKENALAETLREIGRLERTLFTLDWISDPALRRRASAGLNKGEARNALARAIFFHRLGEFRDRTLEMNNTGLPASTSPSQP